MMAQTTSPNEVINLLQKRHATRSISSKALGENVIDILAEAARLTPSCYNKQPWHFLFLLSKEALQNGSQLLAEGNHAWASRAPLLVLAWTKQEDDCVLDDRVYHQFDLGLSVMNIMLAATAQNLVARPMAGFDAKAAKEMFSLDEDAQPLVMLAIGEPASDTDHLPEHVKNADKQPRQRKAVSEIVQII